MAQFLITAPDGRKFRVTGDTREGALAALQAQLGQVQPSDTSMGTAFAVGDANTRASTMGYMADANRQLEQGPLGSVMRWGEENIAQPIANALGVDRPTYDEAQAANQAELDANYQQARGVADQLVEDTNYRSMTTDDINGLGSGLRYIGQKVAESAPAMAGAIASGGAITPALTAGEVNENLRDIEGLSEEDRIRLATTGGAINAILENAGVGLLMKGVPDSVIGKMGIRGVVNLLERNGLGRFVNRVVAGAASEGITEGMQEGVSIGAEAIGGRDFTPEQVVDRLKEAAVAGAAAGGATRGGMSTVGGVVDAVTPNARLDTPENRAAASLAQRLQGIAEANDFNLRDVNVSSTTGARSAVDMAHVQLAEDLKQTFKDMRDLVKPNDLDTLESVQNKIMAEAAYREGRNKTKNTVGQQELKALRELTGQTFEGQKAENLLLELNQLTQLHNDGYKGGISQFTDFANPFDGAGNTYNQAAQVTNRILGPMVSATALYASGGSSLLPQAGIVAAGRTVDAITGRRSRVNKYVKQNSKGAVLQDPNMPSLREAKRSEILAKQAQAEQDQARAEQRAAQRKTLNLQLTKQNAPAALGSPQQVMEEATGLNRNGVARIIRVIEATNQDPLLKEAIDGYRKSVAEGGRVPELTPLIRAVNSMVEKQPAFKDLRVRQPNQGAAQQQFGPQQTTQENYNRGIEDNKAMLRDLKDTARTDKQLSKTDKAKILDALDQLGLNLGKDPMAKVSDIMRGLEGVNEDALATYIAPYVERVAGQQDRVSYSEEPVQQAPAEQGATTGVNLTTSLSKSFNMAGNTVFQTGRELKLELQRRSLEAQKEQGIDLNTLDEENIDHLADFLVEDALEALKDNKNAIGWYDRTVTTALETVAELHPEILSDPVSRLQFTWAVAVTSNGLKVDKNFELALDAYEYLKANGLFPTDVGIGQAADAINSGLAQYHTMLDKFNGDHDALIEFMNSKVPVKQLEKEYGVKISGEGKNTLVRGAAILGPKIGNGFFSNLYGNFDELTMDRWLMRTVGRWRGGLVKINKPMVAQKTAEIKAMLGTLDLKEVKPLFKGFDIQLKKRMSTENVEFFAAEIAKRSMKPDWRKEINAIKGGEDLRKAGNALAKYLDGQVEAPAGAKERDFIRAVFQKGLKRLQDNPAVRQASNAALTMSDLQALLWYPEKRLYDTAKQKNGESRGYEDDEAPDYANAARKAVRNRLGSSGGTGPAGRGSIPSNAGQPDTIRGSIDPQLHQSSGLGGGQGVLSSATPQGSPQQVTQEEVKQAASEVAEVFTIGKAGTKYEKGIKDIPTALRLAKALDYAVQMFDSQITMRYAIGRPDEKGLHGAFAIRKTAANPDKQNLIVSLNPKATLGVKERQTSLGALTTLLHEIAHGIGGTPNGTGPANFNRDYFNPFTNKTERVDGSTFEGAIGRIMEASLNGDAKSKAFANSVLEEVQNLQDNLEVYSAKGPKQAREVRGLNRIISEAQTQEEQGRVIKFHDYVRSIPEFSVDPVWVYLYDPQMAKQVMPYTTRVIQELFKSNNTITFHSHPLAMVVAILLAMLAKGAAGDDEDQRQSPQGILSQGQGALSA